MENKTSDLQNADDTKIIVPVPQQSEPVQAPKKKRKFKIRIKMIIIIVLVFAILAGAAFIFIPKLLHKNSTSSTVTEVAVKRGDISKTITGSGAVQPKNDYDVVSTVTGEVMTDNVQAGQTINQGDLLYTIDSTNAQNTIKQDQNALEKAQLAYNDDSKTLGNLTVTSDITGLITKVYVKNGDQVQANASVMDVVDPSSLQMLLPFNTSDVDQMYIGESAQVILDSGSTISGTVASIYTGTNNSSTGASIRDVEITCSNPGIAQPGNTGTAMVGSQYYSHSSGTFSYGTSGTVTAKAAGQVSGLSLRVGDEVTAGTKVASLTNDSTTESAQTAELAVESAQLALQNAEDQLNDYNITSPISGTVIKKVSKAGDKISGTTGTMAEIADMSSLVVTINVDELDILDIKVGQKATITADAIPNQTFTGVVDQVSTVGNSSSGSSSGSNSGNSSGGSSSSSSGVTTYAVEISIQNYGSLLAGMNVNASIVTGSAQNVLLIPENAVVRGSYVLKKIDSTDTADRSSGTSDASSSETKTYMSKRSSTQTQTGDDSSTGTQTSNSSSTGTQASNRSALQTKAPSGYEYVKVQIGLTNGEYAEVQSGLSEGDTIAYITNTSTTTTTTSTSSSSSGGLSLFGGSANRSGSSLRSSTGGQSYGGQSAGGASRGQS
jgi:HlyD family secretion protein